MAFRDAASLAPFPAVGEPARLGPNIPEDLSVLKRGSICLIIRKRGAEQEVLLIKRATRDTDRWSGHIALPGGRQEPGESDIETGIRETQEEVGIDLREVATYIGPIAPRIIRVSWGRRIAMILCPFVFTINEGQEDVPLVPQESEVAAAFWHPLSTLFDHANRSLQPVAVRGRLNMAGMFGEFVKSQAGEMLFDAIDIFPDESITAKVPAPLPWRMWGITLAIMQDFREIIDPEFSSDGIRLPTFKAPDLRLMLALVSGCSTHRKREFLRQHPGISDMTSRLLDGHFKYFPWVIGTGIVLRIAAAAAAVKWLFSLRKGRL